MSGFKGLGKWECWGEFSMLNLILNTRMIQKMSPSLHFEKQTCEGSTRIPVLPCHCSSSMPDLTLETTIIQL